MKNMVLEYLKEKNYQLDSSNSFGIKLSLLDDELLIKGSQIDLIELADYILDLALSENEKDHLHLDELTLINNDSIIKNVIIEKE